MKDIIIRQTADKDIFKTKEILRETFDIQVGMNLFMN